MRDTLNRLNRADYLLALALAGAALLVYTSTLAPSLSYASPDGNELATIPYVLGLAHMPGYPFYTFLGKLFTYLPYGDIAHRMNLMSAVLGAAGVGGLFLTLSMLLHATASAALLRRSSAAFASILFAFSPTFWSQAVITEVYAPNIAMVALMLLLLLRWHSTGRDRDFFLFALCFGLSLGTHISNLGFAPAFILYVLLTDRGVLKRPSWWLAAVFGFTLGVAQFLWLPLRAGTLNDRLMLANAPTTLKGLFNYTLGAFPQLKFAFSLGQLPDRVVIYLFFLVKQFSLLALPVGLLGLVCLLLRRSKHFFLFFGMYLVHVWFFIQYRAFDLEVFFLPAHYLSAIFVGFGWHEIVTSLHAILDRRSTMVAGRLAEWSLAGVTLALGLIPLAKNMQSMDRSQDVGINDFYANVWEILPEGSALLTQRGVFGYEAFYWRLAYNVRPDVQLPSLQTPQTAPVDLESRAAFSTTPLRGWGRVRGPGALPENLIPPEIWQIPVLVGVHDATIRRGRLVLYSLSKEPPELIKPDAVPTIPLDIGQVGVRFVGADLERGPVESGGQMQLALYWTLDRPQSISISTYLDEKLLETHELGFGNLLRYHLQVAQVQGERLVEQYAVVIPSTIPAGVHAFRLHIEGTRQPVEVGWIEVVDQEETMERWLRIAD